MPKWIALSCRISRGVAHAHEQKASLERCDSSAEPALEFRTIKATRLSIANYNTTLSSDSLETGTGSSNSLRSAKQSCFMRILKEVQRNGPDCAVLRDLKESGELAVEVS